MSEDQDTKKILESISGFVKDLKSVLYDSNYPFGNKVNPLTLYERNITNMKNDKNKIKTLIDGFKTFINDNSQHFSDIRSLPKNTKISYGQSTKIYLDIKNYVNHLKNDDASIALIMNHLIYIRAFIFPTEENISAMEAIVPVEPERAEDTFVKDIIGQVKGSVNEDEKNPMTVIMGMLSSGVLPNLINNIQTNVDNGSMKVDKLLGSMQSAISSMMNDDE